MRRSRTVGLAIGILVVLYIPAVTIWAVLGQHQAAPSRPADGRGTTAASGRLSTTAAIPHGTRQVLHVPLPGSTTTRDVLVYRPAVPDSAELPVLYFLHGYPGSASDVFDAGLPRLIDRLVAEGYPPFVLAAPDGDGLSHRDTEWANAVDGTDQFETFVTGNVIRAVEGSHLRDRTRRAIAGFSMGGYGAVNLALRHPDLYGQVVPIAGYFHVDDPSGVFAHQLAAIDANTPELHLTDARRERILVVDGDEGSDRVVSGESRLFYEQLVTAHVPASYEQLTGGHSWTFVAGAFPDVVRFLEADWSTLQPPVPAVPAMNRVEATGQWQGGLAGANVEVSLVSARDPRAARLEHLRVALGAAPVSYVVLTLSNPAKESAPVSLFKASFVSARGTTVDANPAPSVLDEWLAEATGPGRRARSSNRAPGDRRAPDASVIADAQRLAGALAGQTTVAPGETKTTVLVTTAVVRTVASVFVGDSFAVGTLDPAG
jgi:S-formylglutathione hydrolase FrmB